MKIILDGVRLNELLWNVLLFANKTGVTKGEVYFTIDPVVGRMYAVACDDFIIIQDKIELSSDDLKPFNFTLDNATLKGLEKHSREWKETVGISILTGVDEIQAGDFPPISLGAFDAELWESLADLVKTETPSTAPAADWYLNPDRLKNIPRMKIEGDHPVGFRYLNSTDGVMLAFLYGKSVRGIITSMDETKLVERGVAMWDAEPVSQAQDNEIWEAEGFVQENRTEPETEQVEDDLQGVKAKDWKPDNLTARAEYDTPLATEAPEHVDAEEWSKYGY